MIFTSHSGHNNLRNKIFQSYFIVASIFGNAPVILIGINNFQAEYVSEFIQINKILKWVAKHFKLNRMFNLNCVCKKTSKKKYLKFREVIIKMGNNF